MTWLYSGDPASSDKDQIRFMITDTDPLEMLLQDEEINFAISVEGSLTGAAALCCEVLSRNFGKKADKWMGPTKIFNSKRAIQFTKLAAELREYVAAKVAPYSGGLSKVEKQMDRADSDLTQGAFSIGMMSNRQSQYIHDGEY